MESAVTRSKTCPNCQATFPCCTENCWCSNMPNIMPMNPNEGCLCPDCLSKAIEEKIARHDDRV